MERFWFDHVHLTSADAERAAKFYEDHFGARRVSLTRSPEGIASAELDLSGVRLLIRGSRSLTEARREAIGGSYGLDHFGIRTDNIEAKVASMKSAGVPFRSDTREVRPGFRIAFFWAPDNVLIELMEIKTS